MKYNPLLNDWAASLSGFADAHPQAPEILQGPLKVFLKFKSGLNKLQDCLG